jgi:hypothetical protein
MINLKPAFKLSVIRLPARRAIKQCVNNLMINLKPAFKLSVIRLPARRAIKQCVARFASRTSPPI